MSKEKLKEEIEWLFGFTVGIMVMLIVQLIYFIGDWQEFSLLEIVACVVVSIICLIGVLFVKWNMEKKCG